MGREQDIYERRILEAADDVTRDPRAWGVVEAVAGLFWPRVKADIDTELRRRARSPESNPEGQR